MTKNAAQRSRWTFYEAIKVGESHRMSYAPLNAPRLLKDILTEIRHITFCREGSYKDHYLVGLSIVENEKSV